VLSGVRAPALPPSTLGGRITLGSRTNLVGCTTRLGDCALLLLLLLLLSTLGRASFSDTLGQVALVVACLVGCNKI